jgi:hypothetical protein
LSEATFESAGARSPEELERAPLIEAVRARERFLEGILGSLESFITIRLARELHDSVTQALFAATIKAEALTLDESLPAETTAAAEEVRRLTRGALAQMRTLLLELRADPLDEIPIPQLLRHLAEAAESSARIRVRISVHGEAMLSPALNAPIYRIVQEALSNVARHARAADGRRLGHPRRRPDRGPRRRRRRREGFRPRPRGTEPSRHPLDARARRRGRSRAEADHEPGPGDRGDHGLGGLSGLSARRAAAKPVPVPATCRGGSTTNTAAG